METIYSSFSNTLHLWACQMRRKTKDLTAFLWNQKPGVAHHPGGARMPRLWAGCCHRLAYRSKQWAWTCSSCQCPLCAAWMLWRARFCRAPSSPGERWDLHMCLSKEKPHHKVTRQSNTRNKQHLLRRWCSRLLAYTHEKKQKYLTKSRCFLFSLCSAAQLRPLYRGGYQSTTLKMSL